MKKNILVVEGDHDCFFLHETLTSEFKIGEAEAKIFDKPLMLERAITFRDQASILITPGGGYPAYIHVAVLFTRKFWTNINPLSMGVVGDADCGPVYDQVIEGLKNLLNNRNRVPANLRPDLKDNDGLKFANLTHNQEIDATLWTHEIPTSLQHQISIQLKATYHELKSCNNPDVTIKKAADLLRTDEEEVIRKSVKLVNTKTWFRDLKKTLESRLIV